VDERVNLLDALANKGVCKTNKAGIRLYNQKYYSVRYDEENLTLYLKKVSMALCRRTEEPASSRPTNSSSSAHSTYNKKWPTTSPRTQESSTRESSPLLPTLGNQDIDRLCCESFLLSNTKTTRN
jgi:hypothetical protein